LRPWPEQSERQFDTKISKDSSSSSSHKSSPRETMSFLGIGRPQPTSEQKIAAVEGEMRMMADTYNR
jgi:hypothetical protein